MRTLSSCDYGCDCVGGVGGVEEEEEEEGQRSVPRDYPTTHIYAYININIYVMTMMINNNNKDVNTCSKESLTSLMCVCVCVLFYWTSNSFPLGCVVLNRARSQRHTCFCVFFLFVCLFTSLVVVGKDVGDARGQPDTEGQMQKLVRSVRVAAYLCGHTHTTIASVSDTHARETRGFNNLCAIGGGDLGQARL